MLRIFHREERILESGKDIKVSLKLNGKLTVVTGAARGIGRVVVVAFAKDGTSVIGIDICEQADPRPASNHQHSRIWRQRVN